MSALFLMDIKHKLETGQDIFRAKTVRALVAEIESLTKQRDEHEVTIIRKQSDIIRLESALAAANATIEAMQGLIERWKTHSRGLSGWSCANELAAALAAVTGETE